jgi:hypothetical protein
MLVGLVLDGAICVFLLTPRLPHTCSSLWTVLGNPPSHNTIRLPHKVGPAPRFVPCGSSGEADAPTGPLPALGFRLQNR